MIYYLVYIIIIVTIDSIGYTRTGQGAAGVRFTGHQGQNLSCHREGQ